MEREILAYIKQNRMIGKNDVVLAGVSGGSDSMAMLRILKELQGKLDFFRSSCFALYKQEFLFPFLS